MASSKRTFYGKMLLFGEHSVIDGSKALVMPYMPVEGRLSPGPGESDDGRSSNASLKTFAAYLAENQRLKPGMPSIDLTRFLADLGMGMHFLSTIPLKYGLGSSGAICAAVYDEYGPSGNRDPEAFHKPDIQSVRVALAAMESYFHGQSSGIDPLCIYFNKPIVVEGKHKVIPASMDRMVNQGVQIFLLDTGLISGTMELVEGFRKKLMDKGMEESYRKQYIPVVNHLVDQFVNGILTFESVLNLSVFQMVIFREMIPEDFLPVWQYGLDSEYFALKLCGSGGGGYLLGFTEDFDKAARSLIGRYNITPRLLSLSG